MFNTLKDFLTLSIKQKTTLAIGSMFLVLFVVGGLSVFYLSELSHELKYSDWEKTELRESYNDLNQSFLVLQESIFEDFEVEGSNVISIDTTEYQNAVKAFYQKLEETEASNNLKILDNVITEIKAKLDYLKQNSLSTEINKEIIVESMYDIAVSLNIFLDQKDKYFSASNLEAAEKATQIKLYMYVSGGFAILLGLMILIGFPSYISRPLEKVMGAIGDFKNNRYETRIEFDRKDEIGRLAESFNQMAQTIELYQLEQQDRIAQEETKSEIILNSLNEAVIITDAKKNISFVNNMALVLLEAKRTEIEGNYIPDLAINSNIIRGILQLDNSNKKTSLKPIELQVNGNKRFYQREILDIVYDNGEKTDKSIGKAFILRDVTSYHEKDIAKTNLISTISHELKTPISSIKLSTQLLADNRIGDVNDEQQTLIEDIIDDCERLLKITSELVDMSKIDSGKVTMRIKSIDARSFISKAIDAVDTLAVKNDIDIVYSKPEKPVLVKADLEKCNLVMVNLLSNAVKYSPNQTNIHISITEKPNDFIFSVKDHGYGIAEEHQEKIFERYYQIESDKYDMSSTGTGLGLAIAKDFIEEQKGHIWLESKPGKGSTFSFSLPKSNTNRLSNSYVDESGSNFQG